MTPPAIRLFYLPISHYCVSAERMIAFKGIPREIVPVSYHDKRELIRETRQDYVPAIRSNGEVVTWEQIPDWLDRREPSRPLNLPGRRGLARTIEQWGHQVVEERIWRAVVTEVPPVLGDEHERWVFEEMQTRARGPWHVLESRRPEFLKEAAEMFARIDEMLEGTDWLIGPPSRADFGVFGALSPWITVGHPIPDEYPRLAAWARRIQNL